MLILSRKAEQSIQIGNNVRIQVLDIQGGRVKIGIEAPSSVSILRGELDTFADPSDTEPEEEVDKLLELAVA
jgi:carbon storage regulator